GSNSFSFYGFFNDWNLACESEAEGGDVIKSKNKLFFMFFSFALTSRLMTRQAEISSKAETQQKVKTA
ncbi:hypothetical protein, partial [Flavobacterium sp. GCM10027622]|uniref:hypothetical protein n=1 Tax=unclassified Flavobacterium TaxID=196869 RepID=UPI00361F13C8